MSLLKCSNCSSSEFRKCGFSTYSDGSQVQRYKCNICHKGFLPKYRHSPARYAGVNCKHCGSAKTVTTGKPIKRLFGEVQLCQCKDCGRQFNLGGQKRLLIFLNGKVIHRYLDPPGLHHVPNVACPDCTQNKAVLKTEYQCSRKQQKVRELVCLGCGREFHGDGRPWSNSLRRRIGKTIPRHPWRFEDDLWDLRELYPSIEEHKFSLLFLNFKNCGSDWFKKLVKVYTFRRIEVGIQCGTLVNDISRLGFCGRFFKQQGIASMDEVDRQLLAIYWVQERGHLSRNKLYGDMSSIRGFLDWGNIEEYFTTSPNLITSFDLPKVFHNEPDPLEDLVLEAIRDNLHLLPEPLQLMFILGFWLGARPSELCYMRKDCLILDPDGSRWWVKFERKKLGDEHRLPLATDLVRLIQQQQTYISELHGEDYQYLFCNYQGIGKTGYPNYSSLKAVKCPPKVSATANPMVKAIRNLIEQRDIRDSNGMRVRFTGAILRSSRATQLIRDGYSLEFIRIWLKHRHAITTNRHYARYRPGELLDVACVMANLDRKLISYDSNPESLRQNPKLHELDGLTMPNGEPLYGYCIFREFCPRFGHCYTCGFHVASADKLPDYKAQLERLLTKKSEVFNYGSSEMLESYTKIVNALEGKIEALENSNV